MNKKHLLPTLAGIVLSTLPLKAGLIESRLAVEEDKGPATQQYFEKENTKALYEHTDTEETKIIQTEIGPVRLVVGEENENSKFQLGLKRKKGFTEIYRLDADEEKFGANIGLRKNNYELQLAGNTENDKAAVLMLLDDNKTISLGAKEIDGNALANASITFKANDDYNAMIEARYGENDQEFARIRFGKGLSLRKSYFVYSVNGTGSNQISPINDEAYQFFLGPIDLRDPEGLVGEETGDLGGILKYTSDEVFGLMSVNLGDYGVKDVLLTAGPSYNFDTKEAGAELRLRTTIPINGVEALVQAQTKVEDGTKPDNAAYLAVRWKK